MHAVGYGKITANHHLRYYTVIGYYSDTKAVYCQYVVARSPTQAIDRVSAELDKDLRRLLVVVAIVRGKHRNEIGTDSPRPLTYWDGLQRGRYSNT